MKLVTAIIRSMSLERVVEGLKGIGIKGITISEVKGLGEEIRLYRPYTIHDKIELIVHDEEVERVLTTITEEAHTGEPGDGVIIVQKVKELIKIRTRKSTSPYKL